MTRRTFLQSLPLTAANLGPDGMISLAGRPTFLLGLYSLPNRPGAMQQARQGGFRVVSLKPTPEDFALARQHDMYGWVAVGSDPARIREVVTAFRQEPALLFWETEDEPSYQWKKSGPRVNPEVIKAAYRLIKSLDPSRLVYLNHAPTNLVGTLRQYNPGGDIIATDIYPVVPRGIRELYALWPDGRQGDFLNTHISQVGQYTDKMRRVAGPARAVFMVLQGFAWEDLREKDRDPKMVVYPSRAEVRFMAWQSIVRGANGLLWWGLHSIPPRAQVWDDIMSVAREISSLEEALASRSLRLPLECDYHDTGHSLDRGIEWMAKPERDAVLFIAVNADPNPVDVTFRGLPKFHSADLLFESRPLRPAAGTIRDTFPPFGVRIYRLAAKG